jgi:formylmethanofuran dehydrogenase subunit E
MCIEKTDWEKAIEFHGHICPGLATGYRVSKIALKEIESKRAEDEELVAIVENDACGVDAVQFITGCTLGKGNLLYRDFGKHVYTFVCRNSGRAIRISVKGGIWKQDDNDKDYRGLRERISTGKATGEEKELFKQLKEKRINYILEAPLNEFCSIQHITVQLPSKAKIFNSVTCAYCGEQVSESRARIYNSQIACIPCSEEYTRGW